MARGGFRLWCRPSIQSLADVDAFELALLAAAWAGILLLVFLAGCGPQYEATTAHPNPILIREFAFSPEIVTLDPSFGFSLYRGERGVPREQRAAGLGRAVAFNLTDGMAEYLTGLGYDVLRSETGVGRARHARPDRQRHRFAGSTKDSRRRVGAENSGVAVDVAIDYQVYGQAAQRLAAFQLDSRQVGGGLVGVSARTRGDVKIAAEPARRRTRSLYRRGRAQPEMAGRGALTPSGPDYSSPSARSMRTVLRIAATVSSSSASPCVAEMTPPGWLLRSTPWIIMPSRILCTMPAVRSLFSAAKDCSSGSNLVGVIGARSGFVNNSSEENVP